MTEDRVDERKKAAPAKIDELFRMKMSEFNARRDAGLISSKQLRSLNNALSKQVMEALGGEYATQEHFAQALEDALPVLEEGLKFYQSIDSMTAGELLGVRDAARSDETRRQKARAAGRQGGSKPNRKRPAAAAERRWRILEFAAFRPWMSANQRATAAYDEFKGTPWELSFHRIRAILTGDRSWKKRR